MHRIRTLVATLKLGSNPDNRTVHRHLDRWTNSETTTQQRIQCIQTRESDYARLSVQGDRNGVDCAGDLHAAGACGKQRGPNASVEIEVDEQKIVSNQTIIIVIKFRGFQE